MPTLHDLKIRRGETFTLSLRWESDVWAYVAITGIQQTAPVRITTAPHDLPDGWGVAVVDAKGMTQLNAQNNPPRAKDMRRASVVSSTVVEFNELSAASFGKHTANTGYLAWRVPRPLAGHLARMQIRERPGGPVLFDLDSGALQGITLDDANKVIQVTLTAEQAESAASASGVHDLEIVSPGGVVTALIEGAVTFGPETTTTS